MNKNLLACGCALVAAVPVAIYEMGLLNIRRKQKPDESKIRVACVGDSITYGNQATPRSFSHYPRKLQKLLGDAYQVENFGISQRTVLNSGDLPYVKEKEYPRSLAFRPNIVILKLGTNDTKTFNWTTDEEFEADYRALVQSYLDLDTKPTVYLCPPAAAYDSILAKGEKRTYKITESGLVAARKVVRKVAADMGLPLIETDTFTEGHRDWFVWDGIHPNAKGAEKLAECVYEAIR